MRARNNWVFIKRDPIEESVGGITISEKALVKSYTGVVTHTGSDKYVTCGDRVHIPHYKILELLIDGDDYVVIKDSDLFAKEKDGSFLPINRYVKARKCVNDHARDENGDVALFMTDEHLEKTNWVEIVDVAEDCKHITKEDIGSFCTAPEDDALLARLLYSKEFMLHETKIEFVTTEGGMLKPKNNRVIAQKEEVSNSEDGIVLPNNFKAETDLWKVVSFGDGIKTKSGKIIPVDLSIGSIVMLKKDSWTSISFDGVEYAVVAEDDIEIELEV